jgi:alpha-tubulin suppressor-like RCC1 family protein
MYKHHMIMGLVSMLVMITLFTGCRGNTLVTLTTVIEATPGSVWGWGNNHVSQLGNQTPRVSQNSIPFIIGELTGVESIAAGLNHSLALKSDGTVWAWGYNYTGQLGNGTTAESGIPLQVSGLNGIVSISTREFFSLALKSDGTIWSWGENVAGQLGNGTTAFMSTIPVLVTEFSGVVAIAAGNKHCLALKSDGTVWSWGSNVAGELGIGNRSTSFTSPPTFINTPVQVIGINEVVAIAAEASCSLALKSDGTVWAWGENVPITNTISPTVKNNITTIAPIGTITEPIITTLPVTSFRPPSSISTIPVQITELSEVIAIAAGGHFSLALKSDGTVWAWGHNSWGQLGDGTVVDSSTPVQVNVPNSVKAVAAGYEHALALIGTR